MKAISKTISQMGPVSEPRTAVPAGYVRWLVLFLCWCAQTLTFVDRLAWATVAVEAGDALSIPVKVLGVFVTSFYVGYVSSNIVGGLSTDRFGPERVVLASLAPLGIATFFFGFTQNIPGGLIFQFLMGLAAGANYAATVKLTMAWFPSAERGRAMGLLTSATSFGVVLANALVPTISAMAGWRMSYHFLGVATLIFGICAFAFLRRRPVTLQAAPAGWVNPFTVLARRSSLLLAVAGFCAMFSTWGVAFWANALMTKNFGMSAIQSGGIIALFGLAGMASKPAIGFVLDRVGQQRKKLLLITVFTLFAIGLAVYGNLTSPMQLRIVTPLLGFVAFIYTPLLIAMVSEAAGPERTGTAVGATNAIWQLGSVIVPLAVGFVFDATGSFKAAFLLLAGGPILAAIIMLGVPTWPSPDR